MNMLKKLNAFILSFSLLVMMLPTIISVQANTSEYKFKYVIYSETSHCDHGGTGKGNLNAKVYFYSDKGKVNDEYEYILLNDCGDYKEARGSSATTTKPPWRVSAIKLSNTSSNAYKCHWLKLYVETWNGNNRISYKQIGQTYYPDGSDGDKRKTGKWIDSTSEHADYICYSFGGGKGGQTRNPSEINGWDSFGSKLYLDVSKTYSSTENVTVTLPGTLQNDRWNSLFGGSYNVFDWSNAPNMSFSVEGKSITGKTVNYDSLSHYPTTGANVAFKESKSSAGEKKTNGFIINKKNLLSYMNLNGVNEIKVTVTLQFDWWTFDDSNINTTSNGYIGNDTFVKTYKIYRNAFEINDVKYITNNSNGLFNRSKDNYYFNKQANSVFARINIFYNDNDNVWPNKRYNTYEHFRKTNLTGVTVQYDSAQLQINDSQSITLGKGSSKFQFNEKIELYIKFEIPEDAEFDSQTRGVRLILNNLRFSLNGTTYYLTKAQYDYTNPPYGDVQTAGNADIYTSTHKFDTILPSAVFEFDENEEAVNGWRRQAVLNYNVSEDLYTGTADKESLVLNYRLRDKNNEGTYYSITDRYGNESKNAYGYEISPASKSDESQLSIAYMGGEKEIEGVLELVNTTDIANNSATAVLRNGNPVEVKLDNQPPRLKKEFYEGTRAADGSKSITYSFNVEDASQSARVYYVFTEGADAMPEFDKNNVTAPSGELTNLIGKWAYAEQIADSDAESYDKTNGLALIKAENGMSFSGKIYYFAEDGLGNKTEIKSEDINLQNENTNCEITVANEKSGPQKDYDVSILSPGNKIYYRWQHPSGKGAITDYKLYTSGTETGSGKQLNESNNEITLDGECVLEVKVISPTGSEALYTKNLVFDNSNPAVEFSNANSGTYRSAQTITVKATDSSEIKSATARIVNPDATPIDTMEEFDLSVTDGMINEKVMVTNVSSGAYAITVSAEDNNGYTTVKTSNPFYIRNEAAKTTISVDSDKILNNEPLLWSDSYTLNISVREAFLNASETQILYYRTADSAQEYSAWFEGGKMTATGDGFALDFTLDTPVKLTEGSNLIYVQTVIAAENIEPANLMEQSIIGADSVAVYYDTTAPKYKLNLTDFHTNMPIAGTLELNDNSDGALSVDTNGLSEDTLSITSTETQNIYKITVKQNTENVIYAVDTAGNKTEIPIKISGIDYNAPTVQCDEPIVTAVGERKDVSVKINLHDVQSESVRFALIPEENLSVAKGIDGKIKESYFMDTTALENAEASEKKAFDFDDDTITPFTASLLDEALSQYENESILTYNITLKGISGSYYIGVRAADSLDNSQDIVLDTSPLKPADAAARITATSAYPKEAYKTAMLTASFNVPVYVLPQNMITDTADADMTVEQTNLEKVRSYTGGFEKQYSLAITENGKYKLYTADDLGRTQVFEVNVTENDVTFNSKLSAEGKTMIMYGYYAYVVSTDDDSGSFVFKEIAVPKPVDSGTMVMPGEMYIDANEIHYTTAVVTPPGSEYYLQPAQVIDKTDTEQEEEGLQFSELLSSNYYTDYGYTKLVYDTSRIYKTNDSGTENEYSSIPDKNVRTAKVYLTTADTYNNPSLWTPSNAYFTNIDNTRPNGTATVSPAASRDEAHMPTNFTLGNVNAELKFSDPNSGLSRLEFESYADDGSQVIHQVIPFSDSDGNPIDYNKEPYTLENEYYSLTLYGDADFYGVKTMSIVFYKNVNFYPIAFNRAGDAGMLGPGIEGGFQIDYINKADISPDDYTLSYFYEDYNGQWQPIAEGDWYKNAKAVIEPTESGTSRGLHVVNNAGSNEKLLNSFDRSFSFTLSDNYGYKAEALAGLSGFDENAGEISYSLATAAKTNKPVEIVINVSDSESGVGTVTLARGTEQIPLTNESGGKYKGFISNIGNHVITLTDKSGNVSQKAFIVSNIDKTLPEIAQVEYSNDKRTAKTVSAHLKYSKSGVTLTEVTAASGLTSADYRVDYNNSTIYFKKSGTVNVWFSDDYGNIGSDTVTVSNIYTTPPALEAVMTPSADKTSVSVSFIKAKGENGAVIDTLRSLSEIMVSYNGIAKRVMEEKEEGLQEAVYTFNENGIYTFKVYDDEGVSSYITIEITGIDLSAPKITQIRWSYDYEVLENGTWQVKTANGSRDVENEAGYRIATDAYPITNENVNVTVVTDTETTIIGNEISKKATEHTIDYSENGLYIFNMQKENGLSDSYGFDVAVIDKTPPVIELNASELIFYENPASNIVPYSKDLLAKPGVAFKAYDLFGGNTDLSGSVTIDYGDFNADDITQNTFDRNKPYTITYSVSDDAHNVTEATLTVRLVGFFDTIALVNGVLPDYAGRSEIYGDKITISLKNFSGVSYARIEKGVKTLGQMKKTGTVLSEAIAQSGVYEYEPPENGWYTILVQTDKRDYFNLQIYIGN